MARDTKTTEPTWFMVRKINHYYGRAGNPETDVYEVNYRTLSTLYSGRRSLGWGGDFQTIDEAVAASEAKGWVRVRSWDEAKKLAAPHFEARRAQSDQVHAARKGYVRITISSEPDDGRGAIKPSPHVRWITPELAQELLSIPHTEHGVALGVNVLH